MLRLVYALVVFMGLVASLTLAASVPVDAEQKQLDVDAKYEETVAELLSHVEAEYKQPCEMILHGREFTFSQVWQDWSIFHNYFKSHTLRWGGGTYVDIGTNQPTVISNTIFFDKCLGWKGVCFEPQSRYHAWIKRTRGCTLVPSCVLGSDKGVVSFKGATGGSAALKTASTDDPEAMRCVVAKPILESLNVSSVDLLNIDIEGAEPSVLRCFPFDEFKVGAVLMETALFSGADFAPLNLFFHRHNFVSAHGTHARRLARTSESPLSALDCACLR